ncbi:DNA polymerase delta subunit 3 isoform X3 [Rana temporaria]|uniref:DNA polymerase delta subunit 3 isoform X3 n=1 Tax=Rana temporaria TaxID=8407 RepID=UPI001AAD458D|nr:DNA polymerase delta subunit 3 isoform X3 [Rana temporaria]
MDEMYLDNIDELVTDHNKIVTYKWLSHTLGVHVNQAKQMLYDYVTRKRKENQSAHVHVTYLVTGKCVTEGFPYHKVAVVKEERLEATKSKLAVVANVHVYSVQKATLKDSAPLYNTDYDIVKNNLQNCNKFSAIQCPAAVPRSLEVMADLRSENYHITQEEPSIPRINGHASLPVAKVAAPQPKGIMGMFARSAAKPQESSKETKTEPKEAAAAAPETSSKSSTKSRAMDNFFGKASLNKPKASAPAIEPVKEEKPAAQPIDLPPPEPKEVKETKAPEKGKRTIDVPPPEPKEVKGTKAPEKQKKRLKRAEMSDSDEEGVKPVKRRRRIKQPKPDSSDEEDEVPVPDVRTPSPPVRDVRTPSPPPEPAVKMETEPQPQTQPGEKRRKRRRVLKSKQFLDEDGCMVTEKVYESESYTDSGEEFTKSKPAASNPFTSAAAAKPKAETKTSKKAPAPSKGTKQASIMGFFQKK